MGHRNETDAFALEDLRMNVGKQGLSLAYKIRTQ